MLRIHHCLIRLQHDGSSVPKVLLPRNRVFIDRTADASGISVSHIFKIEVMVNAFVDLCRLYIAFNLPNEASAHESQNSFSFGPVVPDLKNGVKITFVCLSVRFSKRKRSESSRSGVPSMEIADSDNSGISRPASLAIVSSKAAAEKNAIARDQ